MGPRRKLLVLFQTEIEFPGAAGTKPFLFAEGNTHVNGIRPSTERLFSEEAQNLHSTFHALSDLRANGVGIGSAARATPPLGSRPAYDPCRVSRVDLH